MVRYRLRRLKFWLREKLGRENPDLHEIVKTTCEARADVVAANIRSNNCLIETIQECVSE